MNKIISSILLPLVLTLGAGLTAAQGTDCERLKAQAEKDLQKKGEIDSVVIIVRAKDSQDGELIGYCAEDQRKVIIVKRDAS